MKFVKLGRQSRSQDWLLKILFIVLPLQIQHSHSQYYSDACRSIRGKLGTCVPLPACPLFSSWLKQRPLVKQNLRLLVRYTCFFDNENPKVCCPNDNLFGEDDTVNIRFGVSSRLGSSKPSVSAPLPLAFPTPSLTFPSADTEEKSPPPNDEPRPSDDEDLELGDRHRGPVQIPRRKEHVPLTFPTDSHLSSQTDRGKSVWNTAKSKPSEMMTKKDLRLHPNFRLIPKMQECSNAVKLDSLLGTYGGYPWIALIGMKRRRSFDFDHVCAGAVINSRYVVTAGHCFRRNPRFVRLGEYDLNTLIDQGSEFLPQSRREDYRIEKVTKHPDYDEATGVNDIALVRLEKPLALNTTFIRAVCLPFLKEYGIENRLDMNNLEGSAFWVAGWSRHSWDGYSTGVEDATVLQDGIVEHTSHEMCRQDYPHLSAFSSRVQLCVGGKGKRNSCVPDSGGPLMIPLKVPGRVEGFMEPKYFMLGLLSQGPTGKMCQNTDSETISLPTSVYTRISKYLSWILDNIQE